MNTVKLLALAACGAVFAAAAAAIHAVHLDLGYLARFGLIEIPAAECPFGSTPGPIAVARAGGCAGQHPGTNSREAIEQSIADGFRFIEVDLAKTLDGLYFGANRIRTFNRDSGGSANPLFGRIPPSAHAVRQRRIDGGLTPIFLAEIADILRRSPGVWLIADRATDYRELVREFPMTERLIVRTRSLGHYIAARRAGVRHVILGGPDAACAVRYGIPWTSARSAAARQAVLLAKPGNCVACSSYASLQSVPPELARPGVFAYTERLRR